MRWFPAGRKREAQTKRGQEVQKLPLYTMDGGLDILETSKRSMDKGGSHWITTSLGETAKGGHSSMREFDYMKTVLTAYFGTGGYYIGWTQVDRNK